MGASSVAGAGLAMGCRGGSRRVRGARNISCPGPWRSPRGRPRLAPDCLVRCGPSWRSGAATFGNRAEETRGTLPAGATQYESVSCTGGRTSSPHNSGGAGCLRRPRRIRLVGPRRLVERRRTLERRRALEMRSRSQLFQTAKDAWAVVTSGSFDDARGPTPPCTSSSAPRRLPHLLRRCSPWECSES
jgi:hypothetical protein